MVLIPLIVMMNITFGNLRSQLINYAASCERHGMQSGKRCWQATAGVCLLQPRAEPISCIRVLSVLPTTLSHPRATPRLFAQKRSIESTEPCLVYMSVGLGCTEPLITRR
jgi:hypothetical protein